MCWVYGVSLIFCCTLQCDLDFITQSTHWVMRSRSHWPPLLPRYISGTHFRLGGLPGPSPPQRRPKYDHWFDISARHCTTVAPKCIHLLLYCFSFQPKWIKIVLVKTYGHLRENQITHFHFSRQVCYCSTRVKTFPQIPKCEYFKFQCVTYGRRILTNCYNVKPSYDFNMWKFQDVAYFCQNVSHLISICANSWMLKTTTLCCCVMYVYLQEYCFCLLFSFFGNWVKT